jgi:hypothetical protein
VFQVALNHSRYLSDEKQRWEKSEKRREQERRSEKKKSQKKMQMRDKVEKSRNTVFPMICGSGGSKSRVAKAAGAEPSGGMRDEQLRAGICRYEAKHISRSKC